MTRPTLFATLFLLSCLALAPMARADCPSLAETGQGLEAQIKSQVTLSNDLNARVKQHNSNLSALDGQRQAATDPAEVLTILERMDQACVAIVELDGQRVSVLQSIESLRNQLYSVAVQGENEGCFQAGVADQVAAVIAKDQPLVGQCLNQIDQAQEARGLIADWRAEAEGSAGQSQEPPTIRIVNQAGMPICVHPSGMSGGSCFPAGEERVYKLDNLYGWDTDSGQKYKTSQIVIVGGGSWSGSPYTSYQGMTLCTQRTFSHESGEVVWYVTGGLEENCGVRGYHQ